MGKTIILPSEEEVIEYYINTTKTQTDAAEHFNISPATFVRFLREHNLAKSKDVKNKTLSQNTTKYSIPSEEDIRDIYLTQNCTKNDAAKHFNTSQTTFSRWLLTYGIKKSADQRREQSIKSNANKKKECNISVDVCQEYYIDQAHTIDECCEHFGVSKKSFQRFIKAHELIKTPQQILETSKRTSIDKYGEAFHNNKTPETRQKTKDTCVKKYGVENPSYLSEIKRKISDKLTISINYDDLYDYYITQNHTLGETAEFFKVSTSTILARCGDYHITKPDEQRVDNIQRTCLQKYGVGCYTQSDQYKQQVILTSLKKYNVTNHAQKNISHYDIWRDNKKFKEFLSSRDKKYTAYELKEYFNVHHSTILQKIHNLHYEDLIEIHPPRSAYEDEIVALLRNIGVTNFILNDRVQLNGKEIDIYLPDFKIGIEFNGEYFHSEANEKYKDHGGRSTKHQEKSLLAESKGIFLFHIFEHEWSEMFIDKNPKLKEVKKNIINRLSMILGQNSYQKIPARKCVIRAISYDEKKEFLNQNHIQGNDVSSNIFLGLFYESQLISCMTFGSSKYDKYNYELSRFCTKIGYIVQGGASKLFKYFVNNILSQGECVVSYSDITKSNGKIYSILGFKNTSINKPNYWWVNFDTYDIRTRYQEQQAGEVQRMHDHDYYRICDCGTKTWLYIKN